MGRNALGCAMCETFSDSDRDTRLRPPNPSPFVKNSKTGLSDVTRTVLIRQRAKAQQTTLVGSTSIGTGLAPLIECPNTC